MAWSDVFPVERVRSDGFGSSVQDLVALPTGVKSLLRANLPMVPEQLSDPSYVSKAASTVGIQEDKFRILASFSKMILNYIEADKLSINDTLEMFDAALDGKMDAENKASMKLFLSITESEKRVSKNIEAFYFGDSYNFAEFRPLIAPSSDKASSRQLGGNLTINYMSSAAVPEALSLNIGIYELESFAEVIKQAIRIVKDIESR